MRGKQFREPRDAAGVKGIACGVAGESEDRGGMQVVLGGVVVGNVRSVPRLLVPGQGELLLEELVECDRAFILHSAQVDDRPGSALFTGGDVVSAGRSRRARVQERAPDDVDLIVEGQRGLLSARMGTMM